MIRKKHLYEWDLSIKMSTRKHVQCLHEVYYFFPQESSFAIQNPKQQKTNKISEKKGKKVSDLLKVPTN